jgi:IS30 family transposase
MAKYKQLTLDERNSIEAGLRQGDSFKAIGKIIGKDCSTVSKEIRSHMVFKKSGAYGRPFNDCIHRKGCQVSSACKNCPPEKERFRYCSFCGKCTDSCALYEKEECSSLSKPPYVCNGCSQQRFCTLEKRFYDAIKAQTEYKDVLSESRQGVALSEEERKRLDDIISPLLIHGQSLHHICLNHKSELMVSERTLYTYMDANLFSARNIDMPRKVRMRPRRKKPDTIKVDPKCREGRTLDDFKAFMTTHPDTPIVQIDSVEGTRGGAVLLTITFVSDGLQLAVRRDHNDSQSVTDIFNELYLVLGSVEFNELFPVILADNGSEFSDPKSIEFDADGNRRTWVFYCNVYVVN